MEVHGTATKESTRNIAIVALNQYNYSSVSEVLTTSGTDCDDSDVEEVPVSSLSSNKLLFIYIYFCDVFQSME